MSTNIILIGPSGAGKTTVAKLLGTALERPVFELDQLRWGYYNEIGYDATYAQKLRQEQGMKALAEYWKPFDIYGVERILADYPCNSIISLGAGHSVYEDEGSLLRAKKALANHTVILLIPSPDIDESVDILGQRILAKETYLSTEFIAANNDINRYFLEHRSNAELATMTIFTKDQTPDETCDEIIGKLSR